MDIGKVSILINNRYSEALNNYKKIIFIIILII